VSARDLSFRHLIALQTVHDRGSYRRAAEALGYSQAAITQQIATLEKAIGCPVFDRRPGPRPMTLNAVGREVLRAAADLLARADLLDIRVSEVRDGVSGRLSIGTFQSVSTTLLPAVLSQTRDLEPDLDISVFESRDNAELVSGLMSGQLDVTFLIGPVNDPRLTIHEVCRDPFIVAQAATVSPKPSIRLEELAGAPLIGHQDCVCHDMVEQGFRNAGISTAYVFRSNDNGAIQAMVRAGLGVAVMPLLAINAEDPAIGISALDPPLPDRVILIGIPCDRPAPSAARFVNRSLAAAARLSGPPV
jgi:DNA-binding transcriptional LysR family regulator